MFTRSRQSQNYSGTPQRNQPAQNQGGQYQGQQNYNNQANYQGGNQTPQYKQQGTNSPFKQQPQPQQQQQQQQQPNQQTRPMPQQQPQQQQPAQTPQRLKPILKSSSNTAQSNQAQTPSQTPSYNQAQPQQNEEKEPQEQSNNGVDNSNPPESMDGEVSQDVPKWKVRKTANFKVNKRLKRLRMNQRLRKTLQPKNAIMVLNEMKTGVHFTFPEQQSGVPNSLFLVHAEIDGKTFVGQGVSKPLARQNAAENALKSLLLEKMTAAAMKARVDAENEGTVSLPVVNEESESKDTDSITESTVEDHNEIPWSSLASFALYKLFLEWQNQGTVVPVPRPGVSPGKVKKEPSVKSVAPKELPPNPTIVHPVMLLNQMRPGLIYSEVNRVGNPPNITFTLGVEIDGVDYTGTAKNKKDAKKLAAKAALQALYNLTYPDEIQSNEDVNMGQ